MKEIVPREMVNARQLTMKNSFHQNLQVIDAPVTYAAVGSHSFLIFIERLRFFLTA